MISRKTSRKMDDHKNSPHNNPGTMANQKANEDFNKEKPDPADPNQEKGIPKSADQYLGQDDSKKPVPPTNDNNQDRNMDAGRDSKTYPRPVEMGHKDPGVRELPVPDAPKMPPDRDARNEPKTTTKHLEGDMWEPDTNPPKPAIKDPKLPLTINAGSE